MNLIQLFLQNKSAKPHLRIENATGDEATVYIYDIIGGDWFGGITAQDFAAAFNAITADTIHLRFNTPGGDIFEGRAMATLIAQSKAKTIAHIDSIAASAGSWMALQCDEIEIADGAFFMIHNGWTLAMGDKHAMTNTATLLSKLDDSFIDDYTKRTGKSAEQFRAWMDAETWFDAQESVDNGFADRIAPAERKAENRWNLSAYKNAPKISKDEDIQVDRAALERRLSFLDRIAA